MLRTRHGFIVLLLGMVAASVAAQHAPSPSSSPGQLWNALAAGNRRFASGKPERHDLVARRKELTATQSPHVAVLGCADSRVPPELIFDQGLGDLFVVRSAGENADLLSIGSLEYAFEHLGTPVVVVMGHEKCGAVTAACSGEKAESQNLEAVVGPIATSCSKIDKNKPDTLDLAVRDHVHRVAEELLAGSEMLRKAVHDGKLTIIEAYYSLDTGEVTKLH
jgi:carbonic anhydrase